VANRLVDGLRSDLGVSELQGIPIDRFLHITLDSNQPLRNWDQAFNALFEEKVLPPARPPNEVRPLIACNSYSPRNEILVALRCLLSCHSVALLVSDSIAYYSRLLQTIYYLEPFLVHGSAFIGPLDLMAEPDEFREFLYRTFYT
jgi:hypothetical protein